MAKPSNTVQPKTRNLKVHFSRLDNRDTNMGYSIVELGVLYSSGMDQFAHA
jgi:hypothetical protein